MSLGRAWGVHDWVHGMERPCLVHLEADLVLSGNLDQGSMPSDSGIRTESIRDRGHLDADSHRDLGRLVHLAYGRPYHRVQTEKIRGAGE